MAEAQSAPPGRKLLPRMSMRVQLLLVFTVLFTVALVLSAGVLTWTMSDWVRDQQTRSLDTAVRTISTALSNQIDAQTVLEKAAGSADDPGSDDIMRQAYALDARTAWVYTVVPNPDNPEELLFVTAYYFSTAGEAFEEDTLFMTPYEPIGGVGDTAWILPVFSGEMVTAPEIIFDLQGGYAHSGFAPIFNDEGEVVAAVGVDVAANEIVGVWTTVLRVVLTSIVLIYPLIVLVVFLVSGAIVKPIKALHDAALVVEDPQVDFEPAMLGKALNRQDEIGDFSRIFSRMATEVESRQRKLQQQVAELKIEIDMSKQKKAVEEITDTDYFRDLQAKSKQMRRSRVAKTDGDSSVEQAQEASSSE